MQDGRSGQRTARRSTRSTLYLSVPEQMQLLTQHPEQEDDHFIAPTDGEIATRLFLSVPIHPTVLEHPISYGLSMGLRYYSFHRAKTDKKVMGAWSAAMTDPAVLGRVLPLAGATRRWYHQLTSDHARDRGIAGLCGPLRLRHTYFCNLARLGGNPWSISNQSGTGLSSIGQHYMVGMMESSLISPEEREFLSWLMLPGKSEEKP